MGQTYLLLTLVCVLIDTTSLTGTYFWRKYNGTIPHDAFPGGEKNGTKTYIGGIHVPTSGYVDTFDFVSALIIPGDLIGYAANFGRIVTNNTVVRILCSSDRSSLQWVERVSNNCNLVRGSIAVNCSSHFIGRALYENEWVTGRLSLANKILDVPLLENPNTCVSITKYEKLVYC